MDAKSSDSSGLGILCEDMVETLQWSHGVVITHIREVIFLVVCVFLFQNNLKKFWMDCHDILQEISTHRTDDRILLVTLGRIHVRS